MALRRLRDRLRLGLRLALQGSVRPMKTPQERCAELVASHQCSYRAAFHELVLVMAEKGCLPETKDMPPVVRGIWEASEKEAEENRFRREAVAKLKAALTAEELKALGWDGSEF